MNNHDEFENIPVDKLINSITERSKSLKRDLARLSSTALLKIRKALSEN